ncbi:MAG TPA: hypothetical protein VFC00_32585 [Micromonosporaceae bacterium]|nr:hypothetical protein [Micromonosporaceae bacterium]
MPVPTPPDDYLGTRGASKEDWEQFQQVYQGWLESATDEEIVTEMIALPEEGRPFSPSEAWRFFQCELRRRLNPRKTAAKKTTAAKG